MSINKNDSLLLSLIFLVFLILQTNNLSDYVYDNDEGVYLLSAKLISQDKVVYDDFFLGHPILLPLIYSIFYKMNLGIFFIRVFNLLLLFLPYLIIFLFTLRFTKNRFFSFFASILFLINYLLFRYKIVMLEPLMMSLLTLSLYLIFFYRTKKAILFAGILFGLSFLIKFQAITFLISLTFSYLLLKNSNVLKRLGSFLLGVVISIIPFVSFLFTKNFFQNVIVYQFNRSYMDISERFLMLFDYWSMSIFDTIFIFLSLLFFVLLFFRKRFILFSIYNLFSFVLLFFLFKSFFPHYIIQLIPTFCIGFSIFIFEFTRKMKWKKSIVLIIILTVIVIAVINVFYHTDDAETNHILDLIEQQGDNKLFTINPIFYQFAESEIPDWYYITDAFALLNLPEDLLINQKENIANLIRGSDYIIINKKQDWLVNNYLILDDSLMELVNKYYEIKFESERYVFWVKK